MEKFEIDEEKRLNVFSNFVGKVKDALITLIEDSKNNISKYEQAINSTTEEIKETEVSKEKCEKEISKMEDRIKTIIDNIDNVENTYKKIMDAYSETSKGDTKELYSEIIEDAKANCENNVERNKMEIDQLRNDIESIKNNISEFENVIEELNKDLKDYNLELKKFQNVFNYLEKYKDKTTMDLDNIDSNLIETKHFEIKRADSKKEDFETEFLTKEKKSNSVNVRKEPIVKDNRKTNKIEDIKVNKENVENDYNKDNGKLETTEQAINFEESLKQIYDLTGYKPKTDDIKPEKKPEISNIEKEREKVQEKKENMTQYNESDMSEWEKILNGNNDAFMTVNPNIKEETHVETEKKNNEEKLNTVNQLLKPYGTTYENLTSLVGNHIQYKDGNILSFKLNEQDIINAINLVDGTDLKQMKTVGPEVTLLRRVKQLKEGRN